MNQNNKKWKGNNVIYSKFCNFCKNLGKDEYFYKNHTIKECDILKNYQCTKCGKRGHTKKYCVNQYRPRCHYCKEFGHIIKVCPILSSYNDKLDESDIESDTDNKKEKIKRD